MSGSFDGCNLSINLVEYDNLSSRIWILLDLMFMSTTGHIFVPTLAENERDGIA